MLFFTLVLIFAYSVMVVNEFVAAVGKSTGIPSLPKLDEGMVALLGISHAGYLANKGVPHT